MRFPEVVRVRYLLPGDILETADNSLSSVHYGEAPYLVLACEYQGRQFNGTAIFNLRLLSAEDPSKILTLWAVRGEAQMAVLLKRAR